MQLRNNNNAEDRSCVAIERIDSWCSTHSTLLSMMLSQLVLSMLWMLKSSSSSSSLSESLALRSTSTASLLR